MLRPTLVAFLLPASLAAPIEGGQAAAMDLAQVAKPVPAERFVSFDADSVTADELADAVENAGGEIVDVLQPLGIALVRAEEVDTFAEAITQKGVIHGSARNRPVGVDDSDPSKPSRIDDLRLTGGVTVSAEGDATRSIVAEPDRVAGADPFEALQWGNDLVGATSAQAHREATGAGVTVAIIDTGVDGTHPDLAGNLDFQRSRDLVRRVDGVATDPHGHGTHVAGIVGAERNGRGIAGVAPDATLVSLRAGTDNGNFFVYEVASAIVAAADQGADVAVMSFYTMPWLYNCASAEDYVAGDVTEEEIAEQVLVRKAILAAVDYAHERGVTLIAATGNESVDLSASQRKDATSPAVPPGKGKTRVVTDNCLDLPNEAPDVISVSAVGPSGERAPYSNYGLGSVDLVAPGGWFDAAVGANRPERTRDYVLSSFPETAARREGLVDAQGEPTNGLARRDCTTDGCGFYSYRVGTSMAAPFVAGVAALAIEHRGIGQASGAPEAGTSLVPQQVAEVLYATAESRSCDGDELCQGTKAENSLYGRGIVNAAAAVDADD